MKKTVVMVLVALGAITSQASYLYWQVSSSVASTYNSANYAMIKNSNGDAYKIYYGGDDSYNTVPLAMNGTASIDLSGTGSTGLSYYIELFNYDSTSDTSTSVAKSETWTYTSLAEAGFITSSLQSIPKVWSGGSYTPTPEPTSAMLMMVGFALLSLKRKKV